MLATAEKRFLSRMFFATLPRLTWSCYAQNLCRLLDSALTCSIEEAERKASSNKYDREKLNDEMRYCKDHVKSHAFVMDDDDDVVCENVIRRGDF